MAQTTIYYLHVWQLDNWPKHVKWWEFKCANLTFCLFRIPTKLHWKRWGAEVWLPPLALASTFLTCWQDSSMWPSTQKCGRRRSMTCGKKKSWFDAPKRLGSYCALAPLCTPQTKIMKVKAIDNNSTHIEGHFGAHLAANSENGRWRRGIYFSWSKQWTSCIGSWPWLDENYIKTLSVLVHFQAFSSGIITYH